MPLPAREHEAAIAHLRLDPVRKRTNETLRIGRPHRVPDFVFRRVEPSIEDIIFNRRIEKQRILRHHADGFAQRPDRDIADIRAVDQDLPARHVIETRQNIRNRRLSRAAWPDNRDRFPGPGHKIHIRQHRMPRFIRKGHMAELHAPFRDGKRLGVRFFRDFRLRVQNGENAIGRCQRFLDISESFRHAPRRIRQINRVDEKRNQLARCHDAVDDRHPAVPDDGHDRERREKFHKRRQLARLLDGLHIRFEIRLVHVAETRNFKGRTIEAPHDAHAHDAFLQHRRHIRQFLLHDAAGRMQFLSEKFNDIGNHRHNHETQRRQFPLQIHHGNERADKNGRFLHENNEIVDNRRLERLDVIREIAHDLPGAAAVVIGNGQLLQMREKARPKVGDDALADEAHEIAMAECRDAANGKNDENGDDDRIEHLHIFIRQHLVDHVLDDPRHDEI